MNRISWIRKSRRSLIPSKPHRYRIREPLFGGYTLLIGGYNPKGFNRNLLLLLLFDGLRCIQNPHFDNLRSLLIISRLLLFLNLRPRLSLLHQARYTASGSPSRPRIPSSPQYQQEQSVEAATTRRRRKMRGVIKRARK